MEKLQEAKLERIYQESLTNGDNIITVLQQIQNEFGYVSEESVYWFAKRADIPSSKFYGVISFYSQFHLAPRGKNIVTVCAGTVCHVKGAPRIISKIQEDLKLKEDQDTTRETNNSLWSVSTVWALAVSLLWF